MNKKGIWIGLAVILGLGSLGYGYHLVTRQGEIPHLLTRRADISPTSEWLNTKQTIDGLFSRIRKNPDDIDAKFLLALAYIQEAKITGEHPYYYPAALDLLNDVLDSRLCNNDLRFQATVAKASVQLSQHRFADALVTGKLALKLNAQSADVYGVLTDAEVELGHYDQAVKMADLMVATRPDIRSYARVSYLRQIHGDLDGAIEAMKLAVSAGYPGLEQTAWARVTLARLYTMTGNLDAAKAQYESTLAERPNYAFAVAGLGNVAMAHKNYALAEKQFKQACQVIPEVSFYEDLISVYRIEKKNKEADKLVKEVVGMYEEDEASGHIVYLELARFYREHANDLKTAQNYAQKELDRRPDNIDVRKELAAIANEKGELPKAQEHLKVAMRTGSNDPELLCLAGITSYKTGNKTQGLKWIRQALEQNPFLENKFANESKSVLASI